MSDVTLVLEAVRRGEKQASEELLPMVYEELRRMAAARMARESAGHTLQPTALVHEAWLRLIESGSQTWQNRAHFFGAASEAMRRILIERARRKSRLRHGGGQERLNLADLDVAAALPDDKGAAGEGRPGDSARRGLEVFWRAYQRGNRADSRDERSNRSTAMDLCKGLVIQLDSQTPMRACVRRTWLAEIYPPRRIIS